MSSSIEVHVGFQKIRWDTSYFRASTLKKGKQLNESNHIFQVKERLGEEISSFCFRETSINQRPYAVKLKIDCNRNIQSAECECKAGLSKCCKHIAALCIYVNTERDSSKTSFLQQWEKPTNVIAEYSKGEHLGEMFKDRLNKRTVCSVSESVGLETFSKTELYEKIKNIDCAFTRVLKAECEGESIIISTSIVEAIVDDAVEQSETRLLLQCLQQLDHQNVNKLFRCYGINYLPSGKISLVPKNYESMLPSDVLNFYFDNVKVTKSQKDAIAIETRAQSKNPAWFHQRKLRISASQSVHKIMTLQSGDFNKLASQLLISKDINSPAVRYGRDNEQRALQEFCLSSQCCVSQLGLFIKEEQPWLCCSPDGIVLGQECLSLLEIKCPYSCREKPVVDDNTCNVPYLYIDIDGDIKLKETHVYYTQVQASLYILNLNFCDLFVYSPKKSVKVSVSRNEEFLSNIIPTVEMFYFEYYLPVIFKRYT